MSSICQRLRNEQDFEPADNWFDKQYSNDNMDFDEELNSASISHYGLYENLSHYEYERDKNQYGYEE